MFKTFDPPEADEFWLLGFVCNLSFVIWDLNNCVLEKEELSKSIRAL